MDAETPVFGKAELVSFPDCPRDISSTSIVNVGSVLFSDYALDLQREDAPLSQTIVRSFRIPVTTDKTVIGYVQDISFGIGRSKGTRVLVVADLAGTTHIIEVPFGQDPTESGSALVFRRLFSLLGLDVANQDFLGLEQPPAYEATFLISIQRRTPKDFALVQIDGIDIVAVLKEP